MDSKTCLLFAIVLLPLLACRDDKAVKSAEQYLAIGDVDRAGRILQIEAKANPENDAVYVKLGEVYLARGDEDRAVKEFDKALFLNGDKVKPAIAQAYLGASRIVFQSSANAGMLESYLSHSIDYDSAVEPQIVDWISSSTHSDATDERRYQSAAVLIGVANTFVRDGRDRLGAEAARAAAHWRDHHDATRAETFARLAVGADPKYVKPMAAVLADCATFSNADESCALVAQAMKWDSALATNEDLIWETSRGCAGDAVVGARTYLARYPNGKHRSDAGKVISAKLREEGDLLLRQGNLRLAFAKYTEAAAVDPTDQESRRLLPKMDEMIKSGN